MSIQQPPHIRDILSNHERKSVDLSNMTTFIGRKQELARMTRAFDRSIRPHTNSVVVAITGTSGTGKTRLVNKFLQDNTNSMNDNEVLLCRVKCGKSRMNEPLSALKELLDGVATGFRLRLPENDEHTEQRRNRFLEGVRDAVGREGGILTTVCPSMSEILGVQRRTSVESLGGTSITSDNNNEIRRFTKSFAEKDVGAARDRLKYVCRTFFRAVTEHLPIVISGDDMQWADTASLQLLSWMSVDPRLERFLLMMTYRLDEAPNPFFLTILDGFKTRLSDDDEENSHLMIDLQDLSKDETNDLVAAILHKNEKASTVELSELIHEMTQGNTFFTLQFLDVLQQQGMVFYCETSCSWKWADLIRLRNNKSIPNNLKDLMLNKLRLLPIGVRVGLQIVACIASSSLRTDVLSDLVVNIYQKPQDEVQRDMETAYQEGLLCMSTDQDGKTVCWFVHDGIRNAAYASIGNTDNQNGPHNPDNSNMDTSHKQTDRLHHDIGIQLLQMQGKKKRDKKLSEWLAFAGTEQLQLGESCIADEDGFIQLVRLNLRAGEKAVKLSAFAVAAKYFQRGLGVLMDNVSDPWERHYTLTLGLHQLLADVSWCTGNAPESVRVANIIATNGHGLDASHSQLSLAEALGSQGQHNEAIDVAVKELINLKIYPRCFQKFRGITLLMAIRKTLQQTTHDDVIDLPECKDERIILAVELLGCVTKHAVYANEDVVQLIATCIGVNLVLKHGVNKHGISAFCTVGIITGNFFRDVREALRYGKMALGLMEKHQVENTLANMTYWTFLHPWTNAQSESMDGLLTTYNRGMQLGQVEPAFLAFLMYNGLAFRAGLSLGPILGDLRSFLETLGEYGFESLLLPTRICGQCVSNLASDCIYPGSFVGEFMDEAKMDASTQSTVSLYALYSQKMVVLSHYGYVDEADEAMAEGIRHGKTAVDFISETTLMFHAGLIPLLLAGRSSGSSVFKAKAKRRARIAINGFRKAVVKEHRGLNISHQLQLLDAGFLGVCRQSKSKQALVRTAFDTAIQMASKVGQRNDAALGNVLAGHYFERIGNPQVAGDYIGRAVELYKDWGAVGVATHLKTIHGNLLDSSQVIQLRSTNHRSRKRYSKNRYSLHEQNIPSFLSGGKTSADSNGALGVENLEDE